MTDYRKIVVRRRSFVVHSSLTTNRVSAGLTSTVNWVDNAGNQMIDGSGNHLVFNYFLPVYPKVFRLQKREYLIHADVHRASDVGTTGIFDNWKDSSGNQMVDNSGNHLIFSKPVYPKKLYVSKRDFGIKAKVNNG